MTSPNSPRHQRWPAACLITLSLAALLAACAPPAPAIENVSPYKGQGQVAGNAPITVTFDRAMDRGTVESRFELQPAIDGCDQSTCPIGWNGNTITMTHGDHPFNSDAKYRVFVHPGYRDSQGGVNTVEHVWEFHTESAPTVRSASPASGSSGVAIDADVVIQFSRPMQRPSPEQLTLNATSGDQAVVDYHLAVDPNDNTITRVSPLRPLRPNTSYRFSISDQVQDTHNNRLSRRTDIDFTTGPLDLSRSLGFAVWDANGNATRIVSLRPAASLNAPAPSLRLLYQAPAAIRSWGWSFNGTHLYTLEGDAGTVMYVDPSSGQAVKLPVTATSMAASPGRDEIAYTQPDRSLHIYGTATGDIAVPQAGAVSVAPAWSGDGHRLAVGINDGGRAVLGIVDRSTLSRFVMPDVTLSPGTPLSWSYDGRDLAFVRDVGPGKPAEVWIYHGLAADGTLLQKVDALQAGYLSWASDGGTLYAGVSASLDPHQLQRAPARPVAGQSSTFTPIRNTQGGDESPVTPSFDRRLAFVRAVSGVPQLWLINNDGSGLTQLTFANYDASLQLVTFGVVIPQWAPGSGPGG